MAVRTETRAILLALAILGGVALQHVDHVEQANCLFCRIAAVL
ncbi:hypothetical protein [Jannaschia marina]|nr:hypothetical protein [Jannaschia marina]